MPGERPVTLAVKVAVASGPARRFVVGDPAIQIKPVLAGATLTRVAIAEHLANKGDIVVDAADSVRAWRPARSARVAGGLRELSSISPKWAGYGRRRRQRRGRPCRRMR